MGGVTGKATVEGKKSSVDIDAKCDSLYDPTRFGLEYLTYFFFFFSSRRRHTRFKCDWSSDVCSSDLPLMLTRLEQDWGMNYAAPKGVSISGQLFGMDDIRRCGVQNLLDGTQGCAAAPLVGPREVRYRYATQRSEERRVGKECRSRWSP